MAAVNWKDIVRGIAPMLGAALGGPLAATAVKEIADKWLGKKDASETEVAQAIATASIEDLIRLKTVENEFAAKMKELDIDIEKLRIEAEQRDKESARGLIKGEIKWSSPHTVISCFFIGAYFAAFFFVLTKALDVPEWQRGMVATLGGLITTALPQILAWWYGSTFGSAAKTRLLADSVPASTLPPPLFGNGGGK